MEIVGAIALLLFLGWVIPSPLSWFRRRALEKEHAADLAKFETELKLLRTHLHTKMEVDAEGMTQLKAENEKLKQINQNLRVTIQTLSTQPEQAELRLLHIYDRALKIMERKFPVFVPTWRTIFNHAEMEMKQTDQGATALNKRVFRPRTLPEVPAPEQKLLIGRENMNGDDK